jgi:hypothetical protein
VCRKTGAVLSLVHASPGRRQESFSPRAGQASGSPEGKIDLWDAPGPGVTIDEDKLAAAHAQVVRSCVLPT